MIKFHKFWYNQPTASLALLNIQLPMNPVVASNAAVAVDASLARRDASDFNLFYIHFLASPPQLPLVSPPSDVNGNDLVEAVAVITAPNTVKTGAIVIPCFLIIVLVLFCNRDV